MSRRWTPSELAARIDQTLLDPGATHHEVLMACEIARRNQCATVCLNSNRVGVASEVLRGSGVGIAAVVGFPFGASHVDQGFGVAFGAACSAVRTRAWAIASTTDSSCGRIVFRASRWSRLGTMS